MTNVRTTRAFTLIELIAVLLIISLVSAVIIVKVDGPLNTVGMRDAVDQLAGYDRLTRSYCRELDKPAHLVVDLDTGELKRTDADNDELRGESLVVGRNYRISRVLIGEEDVELGSVAVPVSRQGLSPSYALLLEGPGGRRKWLLVSGLTGLLVQIDNDSEVRDALATTRERPDAG